MKICWDNLEGVRYLPKKDTFRKNNGTFGIKVIQIENMSASNFILVSNIKSFTPPHKNFLDTGLTSITGKEGDTVTPLILVNNVYKNTFIKNAREFGKFLEEWVRSKRD